MAARPHAIAGLRLALALLCLLALPAAARSQDSRDRDYAETEVEFDEMAWDRDREILHEGDPLKISGLEQGDNEIRSRTPALAKTDGRVAMVDTDELRERKLAMYEGRQRFHRPLALAGGDGAWRKPPEAAGPADPRDPAEAEDGGVSITLALGLVLLVLLFIVAMRIRAQLS